MGQVQRFDTFQLLSDEGMLARIDLVTLQIQRDQIFLVRNKARNVVVRLILPHKQRQVVESSRHFHLGQNVQQFVSWNMPIFFRKVYVHATASFW